MFISKKCGCRSKGGECCCSDKDLTKLTNNLTLLSIKSRLAILFLLKDKPHCVCDLVMHTDMSQSLISHHLADLTDAGLIMGKREGKYVEYSLTHKGERSLEALFIIMGNKEGGDN